MGVAVAAFWLVLGATAGVAQASVAQGPIAQGPVAHGPVAQGPVAHGPVARAGVDGVTAVPEATCLTGGVRITNASGGAIAVRVDLDGSPAFSGDPVFTIEAGNNRLLSGAAPTSGPGVYSAYLVNDDDTETLIATATYVKPGYCGAIEVSYNDKCETVTATVTNHYGSAVTISFVKVSGATYPIGSLTVPDGQTASVDLAITVEVYDIGAYLTAVSDYLNKVPVKGLGKCPATTTNPAGTTPAPTNLASTGNGSLVPVTVAGVSLILCGVLVIIGLRRFRFR
jgi:hypothetical protein